jgi:hypothetical protein
MKKIILFIFLILTLLSITFYQIKTKPIFISSLENSINLQGNWIVKNQTNKGDTNYLQDIKTGKLINDNHIVRQTAILFALSQLYEINKNFEFKQTLEKGFDYFDNLTQTQKTPLSSKAIIYNGQNPSSASAFILLGLIQYMKTNPENQSKYLSLSQNLANYIVSTQDLNGSFTYFYGQNQEDEYNDGESLLALIQMYNFSHNFLYLSTAQKAADYQLEKYNSKPVSSAYFPWGMDAFANLYKIDPQEKYWNFMKTYTDKFFESQTGKTMGNYLDKKNNIPPSGNLSVYVEGFSHVAWIAKEKDQKYFLYIKNKIEKSLDYLMTLQINGPKSKIKSQFPNIQGGMCFDPKCDFERIDTVQHNISAIYYYLKFVR